MKVAVNDEETADMLGTFNQSSHRVASDDESAPGR